MGEINQLAPKWWSMSEFREEKGEWRQDLWKSKGSFQWLHLKVCPGLRGRGCHTVWRACIHYPNIAWQTDVDSVRSPEQIRAKRKMEIHKFHPKHTWGQVNGLLSFFRLHFYLYPSPEIIEFFGSKLVFWEANLLFLSSLPVWLPKYQHFKFLEILDIFSCWFNTNQWFFFFI